MKTSIPTRIAALLLAPILLLGCSRKTQEIEIALDDMEAKCDRAGYLLHDFTNAASIAEIKATIEAVRECAECKQKLGVLYREDMNIGQKRRFMNYLTKQEGDGIALMNQILEKRQRQLEDDPMIQARKRGPATPVPAHSE